jgi:hypothetical protein
VHSETRVESLGALSDGSPERGGEVWGGDGGRGLPPGPLREADGPRDPRHRARMGGFDQGQLRDVMSSSCDVIFATSDVTARLSTCDVVVAVGMESTCDVIAF